MTTTDETARVAFAAGLDVDEYPAIGRSTREMAEMQKAMRQNHSYSSAGYAVVAPDGWVMARASTPANAEKIVAALNAYRA